MSSQRLLESAEPFRVALRRWRPLPGTQTAMGSADHREVWV